MIFGEVENQADPGAEIAVSHALVKMMLQSTWRALQNKEYEFAFEYPIAILSLEKNNSAAYALAAVSLSFISDFVPWLRVEQLLARYLAQEQFIQSMPHDVLERLVQKDEQRQLLSHARRLQNPRGPAVDGIDDLASKIVVKIALFLHDLESTLASPDANAEEISRLTIASHAYALDDSVAERSPFLSQKHDGSSLQSRSSRSISSLEVVEIVRVHPSDAPAYLIVPQNLAARALRFSRVQLRLFLIRALQQAARSSQSTVSRDRRDRK